MRKAVLLFFIVLVSLQMTACSPKEYPTPPEVPPPKAGPSGTGIADEPVETSPAKPTATVSAAEAAPIGVEDIDMAEAYVEDVIENNSLQASSDFAKGIAESNAPDDNYEDVFIEMPSDIYKTLGSENGMTDTFMYADGKIAGFSNTGSIPYFILENDHGDLMVMQITPLLADRWESLSVGDTLRVYFFYSGYSLKYDLAAGSYISVLYENENISTISSALKTGVYFLSPDPQE